VKDLMPVNTMDARRHLATAAIGPSIREHIMIEYVFLTSHAFNKCVNGNLSFFSFSLAANYWFNISISCIDKNYY